MKSAPPEPKRTTVAVHINKGDFLSWPKHCVCCFGPSELEMPVRRSEKSGQIVYSVSWKIPYCSTCKRHTEVAARLRRAEDSDTPIYLVFLALAIALAAAAICGSHHLSAASEWLAAIFSFSATIALLFRPMKRRAGRRLDTLKRQIKGAMLPACTAEDLQVWYHTYAQLTVRQPREDHWFAFTNAHYAAAFYSAQKAGVAQLLVPPPTK